MAKSAREIFEPIGRLGSVRRLRGISATMRFDVTGAGSWHIAIDDGVVTMTESSGLPIACSSSRREPSVASRAGNSSR